MFYFVLHVLVVISWMVFLLQFIKSVEWELGDSFIYLVLSLLFLILSFGLGIKLVTLNMDILKTGGWLHLKITLAFLLGLENIFFAIKFFRKKPISKKFAEISYWVSYVIFMFILFLTFIRPF